MAITIPMGLHMLSVNCLNSWVWYFKNQLSVNADLHGDFEFQTNRFKPNIEGNWSVLQHRIQKAWFIGLLAQFWDDWRSPHVALT